MQFARGIYKYVVEVTVLGDAERWCCYVDPFLVSRNTLGNGKTANSKSQRQMSNGGSGMRWWFCGSSMELRNGNDGLWSTQCGSGGKGGELYTVSELEARSLSSRNTLGDTTHNTNKIGLS